MRLWRKKSVFFTYLLSYTAVVLLCLGTIALFTVFSFASIRDGAYREAVNEKLAAVLNDTGRQMEAMEDIALKVATSDIYNRKRLKRNKYYETELLRDFATYLGKTPLASEYFLFYHEEPELTYRMSERDSEAFSTLFSYYSAKTLGCADGGGLRAALTEGAPMDFQALRLSDWGGPDDALIIYSVLRTSGNVGAGSAATMCFVVRRERLEERVRMVTSGLGEAYALYFRDTLLTDPVAEPAEGADIARGEDGETRLSVAMDVNSDKLFVAVARYENVQRAFFALTAAIFLAISALAAFVSYRPIRVVLRKYAEDGGAPRIFDTNELDNIDRLLTVAHNSVAAANSRSIAQVATLRRQLMMLLLHGVTCDLTPQNMALFRDGLRGPLYCVINLDVEGRPDEAEMSALPGAIEDLSEEGAALYCCFWNGAHGFNVLVSMSEEGRAANSARLICELAAAKGLSLRVRTGTVLDEPAQLHASYMAAIRGETPDERGSEAGAPGEMREVLEYIDAHVFEADFCLTKVAETFNMSSTSLSGRFKSATGINYISYVVNLKMNEARRLLEKSDEPVAAVCERVGYGSISYFIKAFKEATGATPSAYRLTSRGQSAEPPGDSRSV